MTGLHPEFEIIDTFPTFLESWATARHRPVEEQVEEWATRYMADWPELFQKQIEDYASQNVDWRQVAREKVFPALTERLAAMEEAHRNLLELCPLILSDVQRLLGFSDRVNFVIYVGVGCGAGWATQFNGAPAVLFGLENIAECGWSGQESIKGLIAHELAHLVHYQWRAQSEKPLGEGPWWQLYCEGFAKYCEDLILASNAAGQTNPRTGNDWLIWCQSHKDMLAAKFIQTADRGESPAPFFGSWFDIEGQSETGYFLGSEVIRELVEQGHSLKEIALLDDVEKWARPLLVEMEYPHG